MRLLFLAIFSLVACGQHHQSSGGSVASRDQGEVKPQSVEESLVRAINADAPQELAQIIPDKWGVNDRFSNGKTPLTEACAQLKVKVIQELLRMGADIEAEDQDGKSGRSYAAGNALIRRLIFPEEINALDRALVSAIRAGNIQALRKLLGDGGTANWSISDERVPADLEPAYVGETPLTLGVLLKSEGVVRSLLAPAFKVDPNLQNQRGETPLRLCRNLGLPRIERLLLQSGAVE